jgi:CRISPR system Cascade subunit CasC
LLSIPGAKRASTAPHAAPSLVHLVVRSDRPVSLARAFEKPISVARREYGYDAPSQQGLADYAVNLGAFLGDAGVVTAGYARVDPGDLKGLGDHRPSLPDLVDATMSAAFPASAQE